MTRVIDNNPVRGTNDGPDDTVVHARESCTLGSAFNASPFPKDYCGRSVAGNHSLRGLDS